MTYQECKNYLIDSLTKEIYYHISGNFDSIGESFDQFDEILPRDSGDEFNNLHIALNFWDCWIDCKNHEWKYYPDVSKSDWPVIAEKILNFIKQDLNIDDQLILSKFDFRKK